MGFPLLIAAKHRHQVHFAKTADLARQLDPEKVYKWLVTKGYFPESYVLPPCFKVTKHPKYGKQYYPFTKKKATVPVTQYQEVHFPKSDLTDRTFGIIHPEIHSDMALTIATNWKAIVSTLFHAENKVASYSFPIPLDSKNPGSIGKRRAGRMIYEYIEMAESDTAAIAYRYKYLFTTDIKNFYPSIYTHSIAWALHGMMIRNHDKRGDFTYYGNQLDKLFQNSNDGCTNGIPIGPAVSDLIAEIVLSAVDRELSKQLSGDDVTVVRFKDDYRILAKSEDAARSVIKCLQAALKIYRLELNDSKTTKHRLPEGIFRKWVSEYHAANPRPKAYYYFRRFKEVYYSVIKIDRDNPGCGVIDSFLANLLHKDNRLRIQLTEKTTPKVISLLLLLAELRVKSFPKILGIIEAILRSDDGEQYKEEIVSYLTDMLRDLEKRDAEHRYLITWIWYFLRSNGLEKHVVGKFRFKDPIVNAAHKSVFRVFGSCKDFTVFWGVKNAGRKVSMLEHLDVFKPQ